MKPERKDYIRRLIQEIREDFLQPFTDVEGDSVYEGKFLNIDLLCSVIEQEILFKSNRPQNPPVCKHGKTMHESCKECNRGRGVA